MAKQKKITEVTIGQKDAQSLAHAIQFLLAQDLNLLRPGNWRESEWAMTLSSWAIAQKALDAAICKAEGV